MLKIVATEFQIYDQIVDESQNEDTVVVHMFQNYLK